MGMEGPLLGRESDLLQGLLETLMETGEPSVGVFDPQPDNPRGAAVGKTTDSGVPDPEGMTCFGRGAERGAETPGPAGIDVAQEPQRAVHFSGPLP